MRPIWNGFTRDRATYFKMFKERADLMNTRLDGKFLLRFLRTSQRQLVNRLTNAGTGNKAMCASRSWGDAQKGY